MKAQQIPQFSQYLWNNYLINPAIGGAENFIEMKMGYRNQWVGLEGAPQTFYFTINGQLGKKSHNNEDIDVLQNESRAKKPYNGVQKALGYKKKRHSKAPSHLEPTGHHGIGMQIMHDRIGPFNNTRVMGSYAYHLHITKKVKASLGGFMGVKQYRLNTERIILANDNDNTISAASGIINTLSPDGSLGALVYSDHFYWGFSIDQIMNKKLTFTNVKDASFGRLSRHYFMTAGYRFNIPNKNIAIVPSIMTRVFPNTPVSFDYNLKINYHDILWMGASYRHKESLIALIGVHLHNQWDFSYSYDFSTSALSPYNFGSHEIVVGYRLVNKNKPCKPSYVW